VEGTITAPAVGTPWRRVVVALVAASLVCAPVSWIDNGVTPSFVVSPLVLLAGLWRMHQGGGALYFGIAATVFLAIHVRFTWAALFGDESPLGANEPYSPAQWTATLFVVPLSAAARGFLAWRNAA